MQLYSVHNISNPGSILIDKEQFSCLILLLASVDWVDLIVRYPTNMVSEPEQGDTLLVAL